MYADDGGNIFAGMYHGGLLKSTQPLTSVEVLPTIPHTSQLFQNYPNPFNPVTQLQFANSKLQMVTLKVYDIIGREIATLVNEIKAPGEYYVGWDASSYPSGVYFYRLQTEKFSDTKKMLLMK